MGAIQDALKLFGISSVEMIQQNISTAGKDASGETSRDITSVMPKETQVVVSGPSYVFVLEKGRRPGGMPPVRNIARWVQAKSIAFDKEAESIGFAISKKIAEKGTKLFQDGGRTDIITPVISDERIDKLVKQIADISLNLMVDKIDETLE